MLTATEWHGCYDEGWKGVIVDEAFSHPAKMSYALAGRIYDHAFKAGWLKPGDTVVDPFGGIGGTAIHAACHGLRWIGCELEPKFQAIAEQNFALWRDKWGTLPEWVQPTIHLGDSRRLSDILELTGCIVSSPPFCSSEPCQDKNFWINDGRKVPPQGQGGYGSSDGQLGSMKEGEFSAVVSSPPFAVQQTGGGIAAANGTNGNVKTGQNCGYQNQALADGNLAALKDSDFAAVVSSPPYEGIRQDGAGIAKEGNASFGAYTDEPVDAWHTQRDQANVGNLKTGDTFWVAAREIVEQCHNILCPGGHAIWVCKDFVRKGKRVPFSDQWQALCESVGFQSICRHRAMLVKTGGTQKLLDGGEHITTRERKSFFRRLAEKKGSPRIDWEDVICVRKQGDW